MFNSQVENSNKSMIGGVNGVMTGRYGLSVSTNWKPVTWLILPATTGAATGVATGKTTGAATGKTTGAATGAATGDATGAATGAPSQSKKSTSISIHPFSFLVHALSE